MQRLNIVKYIEEKEQENIMNYDEILIIMDGSKYTHAPAYCLVKKYSCETAQVFYETINKKLISNKKQLACRLQYLKQSGYSLKEYSIADNKLTIVME